MGRSMSETRKLAAILVADVVGYSRLAGADEDRTLSRLRGLRSDRKTSTSVANAVDGRAISAGPPRLGSIASRPAGLRSASGGQG